MITILSYETGACCKLQIASSDVHGWAVLLVWCDLVWIACTYIFLVFRQYLCRILYHLLSVCLWLRVTCNRPKHLLGERAVAEKKDSTTCCRRRQSRYTMHRPLILNAPPVIVTVTETHEARNTFVGTMWIMTQWHEKHVYDTFIA